MAIYVRHAVQIVIIVQFIKHVTNVLQDILWKIMDLEEVVVHNAMLVVLSVLITEVIIVYIVIVAISQTQQQMDLIQFNVMHVINLVRDVRIQEMIIV